LDSPWVRGGCLIPSRFVVGTWINVAAIVVGGVLGFSVRKELPRRQQEFLKVLLAVLVLYTGFRMVWFSVGGSLWRMVLQLLAALLALILGNLIGKAAGLQRQVNALGRYASERYQRARTSGRTDFTEGFVSCTILFCLGPLAILGAVQEGLSDDPRVLLVKALLDAVAALAFVRVFGAGVLLSALPVLAYQGTLTLMVRWLRPMVAQPAMLDGVGATGGLLVAMTSLLILEVKKVPLADYLPALILAPVLWLLIVP